MRNPWVENFVSTPDDSPIFCGAKGLCKLVGTTMHVPESLWIEFLRECAMQLGGPAMKQDFDKFFADARH